MDKQDIKKVIYAAMVLILLIAFLISYSDKYSPAEMISIFVSSGSVLAFVWQWLEKREVVNDFEKAVGITHKTFIKQKQ